MSPLVTLDRKSIPNSDTNITTEMIPPTRPTIRFHKWRTAKRNFINQIALPGLKYGKMPAPRDLQILFDFPHEPAGAVSRVSTPAGATTAPQHVLSASDTARMEEWANTHGANANSLKAPGALTASDRTTLLEYLHAAATEAGDRVLPRTNVSRGAPPT